MKMLLALLLSLVSSYSFGFSAGGVQLCGKKPTLYAFYEGANPKLHNIKLWKDDKGISREEYILRALDRLKKDSPQLYSDVREKIVQFQVVEVYFMGGGYLTLTDIPFVNKDCTYEQVANKEMGSKFLFVELDIYRRLSPMNQAGLIVQEALFQTMIEIQEEEKAPADFARLWVAKIFSDEPLKNKINTSGMTVEQKKNATIHLCTKALNLFTKQLDLFVSSIKICKEKKDAPAVEAYDGIKSLMRETINDCRRECEWEEGLKQCNETSDLIEKENACD